MLIEDQDAYTIPAFCKRHSFSPAKYFQLQQQGEGPRVMRIGKRVLISKEAAAEWRRSREEAASIVLEKGAA